MKRVLQTEREERSEGERIPSRLPIHLFSTKTDGEEMSGPPSRDRGQYRRKHLNSPSNDSEKTKVDTLN